MPTGYLIAVALYLVLKKPASAQPKGESRDRTPYPNKKTKTMDLQFYHFIPIFRYYLVVKEKTAEDIEATFRVNSLSSFTLGVAQISGMLFLLIINQQPATIFVKINILSQAVNWLITILYFLTPMAAMMGGQLHVASLNEKTEDDLRQKWLDYLELRLRACNHMKESERAKAQQNFINFERTVHAEIYYMANASNGILVLEEVDMRAKLEALRLLRRKDNLQ